MNPIKGKAKTKAKPEPPKRERGRPPGGGFKPTPEQREVVRVCAGYRMPLEEIALVVINPTTKKPISKVTLLKHFREEIDRGFATIKMRIMAASVRSAIGVEGKDGTFTLTPNVTAQIWLQKSLYGARELVNVEAPADAATAAEGDEVTLESARRVAFTLAYGARLAGKTAQAKAKKA